MSYKGYIVVAMKTAPNINWKIAKLIHFEINAIDTENKTKIIIIKYTITRICTTFK